MKTIKPTESELEILAIIWKQGSATVRDVHTQLEQQKNVGYTTTLKLMQIMHDKGLLKRKEAGKSHIYTAVIKKEKTQEQLLNNMIDNVFNGSTMGLVMQALGNKKTSQEELDAIRAYLDELK